MIETLIGLAGGAVGGNLAGNMMRSNMGTAGRSLSGVVGGALLSFVLAKLGVPGVPDPMAGAALTLPGIIGSLVSGTAGGGILTAILGKVMK